MALLAAFGMMNLWGVVALTGAVVLEKAAPYGDKLARVFGMTSLVFAVIVWWVPAVAPGLTGNASRQILVSARRRARTLTADSTRTYAHAFTPSTGRRVQPS